MHPHEGDSASLPALPGPVDANRTAGLATRAVRGTRTRYLPLTRRLLCQLSLGGAELPDRGGIEPPTAPCGCRSTCALGLPRSERSDPGFALPSRVPPGAACLPLPRDTTPRSVLLFSGHILRRPAGSRTVPGWTERKKVGAPPRSRTGNICGLKAAPLPVGPEGQVWSSCRACFWAPGEDRSGDTGWRPHPHSHSPLFRLPRFPRWGSDPVAI